MKAAGEQVNKRALLNGMGLCEEGEPKAPTKKGLIQETPEDEIWNRGYGAGGHVALVWAATYIRRRAKEVGYKEAEDLYNSLAERFDLEAKRYEQVAKEEDIGEAVVTKGPHSKTPIPEDIRVGQTIDIYDWRNGSWFTTKVTDGPYWGKESKRVCVETEGGVGYACWDSTTRRWEDGEEVAEETSEVEEE